MNAFDKKLKESGQHPLRADSLDTFVVNFGLGINLRSMYYYSEALTGLRQEMSLKNVEKTLDILSSTSEISLVEITGASPESNPHFKYFVRSAYKMGKKLAVVSNPASYTEKGLHDIPEFLAEHKVKLLAFVPDHDKNEVDRLMGKGTFNDIITSLRIMNTLGYAQEGSDLTIALVYFPARPELASDRKVLHDAYRKSYKETYGVDFNHFIVFNTLPIGKFNQEYYMADLKENFNPRTFKNLPCRHAMSIGPDGRFHDCDFLVAAGHRVNCQSNSLDNFDYALTNSREIATSELCFICTAGEGATCADCFT